MKKTILQITCFLASVLLVGNAVHAQVPGNGMPDFGAMGGFGGMPMTGGFGGFGGGAMPAGGMPDFGAMGGFGGFGGGAMPAGGMHDFGAMGGFGGFGGGAMPAGGMPDFGAMGGFGGFGGFGGADQGPEASDMKELPEKEDDSGFPMVKSLKAQKGIPDAMKFMDGKEANKDNWSTRADEISRLYQYYMYGVWPDRKGEKTTFEYDASKGLTIHIKRISTGKEGTMTVSVRLPDSSKVKMPEGGWPYLVAMTGGVQEQMALNQGVAVFTLNTGTIAADNNKHQGMFYELYPYTDNYKEQTGVLMAWAWGASKVIDALEAGADKVLKVNAKNSMVTGVSRWGKSTMVCGAFEKRFKMVIPSCSGTGGVAMFRYLSKGKTYDLTLLGGQKEYQYGDNEQLHNLQTTGGQGWFNNKFCQFRDPETLPFDQHMLCSLVADKDRYLFIIGSCTGEDWVNAPSMWAAYRATRAVYEKLGLGDHLACNIHLTGHAVTAEDMGYILDYFFQHVYGEKSKRNLTKLTSSVFELKQNKDPFFDSFGGTIPIPPIPPEK